MKLESCVLFELKKAFKRQILQNLEVAFLDNLYTFLTYIWQMWRNKNYLRNASSDSFKSLSGFLIIYFVIGWHKMVFSSSPALFFGEWGQQLDFLDIHCCFGMYDFPNNNHLFILSSFFVSLSFIAIFGVFTEI